MSSFELVASERVAVVVPTVDRAGLLDRCLRSLAAQTRPADEIVVVHVGDPGVVAVLEHWRERLALRVLRANQRGASRQRNLGWRACTAPLVAFTDDDCAPDPGWLAALTQAGGALMHGPVLPHPDDGDVRSAWARTLTVPAASPYFPTANLAVSRPLLELVGGFDETLSAGEDTDLAWRVQEAGSGAQWVPDGLVRHAVRPASFPQHLRSLPRWVALPEVVRRHPQLRHTLPHPLFWKATHPVACLALIGAALSWRRPSALVLVAPMLVRRWRERGLWFGSQAAAADLAEVAVVAVGSVRAKSLLL